MKLLNAVVTLTLVTVTHQVFARATDTAVDVPEITVLGDQSKTSTLDFVPTVGVLSGAKLERRKASTLGETLSHETGVSSSFFGPNASRPVIRGLGGERIRVLQNGTGVLDASAASEDHAIALDPLVIDRVEIVRGAATLLYGSSAVGGAVNVLTNRIPEKVPDGFTGKAESRYTSVDTGAMGALSADYGVNQWAIHADGSTRNSSDYSAPAFGKVTNSFNNSWNGALGTSYVGENGFVGGSFAKYGSTYGTVAEKAVSIQMKQDRYDLAAGLKNLGWIESLKFKNTFSNYQHQEVSNGTTGTTFKNRGDEARLELKHQKVSDFSGIFGLQANVFDFEALGEEAFLPVTKNQTYSAFLFEEAKYGSFQPSVGLRIDNAAVKSQDSAAFGASETKSFTGTSGVFGLMYALNPVNSLVLGLGYTERAPNYQELFANGAHVATGVFEVGNRSLEKERSKSAELSLRHKADDTQGSIGVFVQDFDNFIALAPAGTTRPNADGEQLPEYDYRAVRAMLYGAEFEVKRQMPDVIPGGVLEAEFKVDLVYGRDKTADRPLPRITPMRESLSLTYKANRYSIDAEIQRVEKQTETAVGETETGGYHMVNLGLEAPLRFDVVTVSFFARANNLFDVDARNHVSVLKNAAPLPGRNVTAGLQALF